MENIEQRESKKGIQYPRIAEEILKRVEVDQDMRSKTIDDDSTWDESIDQQNTQAMERIVAEIGWPTISKVGAEAANAAWLLVQHADHNPVFQQYCLTLMLAEPSEEVTRQEIAYLEDRVRVNTNRAQLYGTQFTETRDVETAEKVISYGPRPIEDFANIDSRRNSMGLGPFEEYRNEITKKYYPHLLEDTVKGFD